MAACGRGERDKEKEQQVFATLLLPRFPLTAAQFWTSSFDHVASLRFASFVWSILRC